MWAQKKIQEVVCGKEHSGRHRRRFTLVRRHYAGEGMSRTVAQRQEHAGVATSPKGQWPMEEATLEQVLP